MRSSSTRTSRSGHFIKKKLYHAGISKVVIERTGEKIVINIHTARPGILIGKRGAEVETLREELKRVHDAGRLHQHQGDPQGRARRPARGGEHRAPARAPRRLPSGHEEGDDLDDEVRRRGHPHPVLGAAGRRRDGSARVVPRRSGSAAHAARRDRVRLRRGEDHLRRDRREVLGLQGRGRRQGTAQGPAVAAPRRQVRRGRRPCCSRRRSSIARCSRAALRGKALRGQRRSRSATTVSRRSTSGFVTARQIEAARIAMTRHVKRGGKVWIRIFPDKPITKKPAETRMGKGKGNPEEWVAAGEARPDALRDGRRATRSRREALRLAAHKLADADALRRAGR